MRNITANSFGSHRIDALARYTQLTWTGEIRGILCGPMESGVSFES